MAKALDVSPKTVSHWENDEREPDYAMLQKIAYELGTSMGYLLGETDDPSPSPKVSAANEGVRPGTPQTPETQLIIERAVRNTLKELEEWKRQREKHERKNGEETGDQS